MSEDWIGLLNMLPEPWRPYLLLVFEVIAVCSALAAVAKPLLGQPKPGIDARWKAVLYGLFHAIDLAAANTTPVREKLRQARASMPPSRHSMAPGGGR